MEVDGAQKGTGGRDLLNGAGSTRRKITTLDGGSKP